MYLDTTILQSRTTTTLIEFIDELIKQVEFIDDSNVHKVIDSQDINISNELYRKYKEIKKQHKKAMKLDSRGKRLSQE